MNRRLVYTDCRRKRVYLCPRCLWPFGRHWELKQHLVRKHGFEMEAAGPTAKEAPRAWGESTSVIRFNVAGSLYEKVWEGELEPELGAPGPHVEV